MNILFIGAGNMGQAIIGGIVDKKIINPADIYIMETNKVICENVVRKYEVRKFNQEEAIISNFDIIVLAIKPQVFHTFKDDANLNMLRENISKDQIIVSIMAGITIEKIKSLFSKSNPIVRVMPNTPALISRSMSVLAPSKNISEEDLLKVKNIFEAVGEVEILDENLINAVTGLSGSGPAYVFAFIEALIQGGISCGLKKEVAEKLAVQTVIGASLMIDEENKPEELRKKVTSPGGTTVEGLSVLEKREFRSIIVDAVKAAAKRSEELSSSV